MKLTKNKSYGFWIDDIKYTGEFLGETETHWVIKDTKYYNSFIWLPKAKAVALEVIQK